MDKQWKMEKAFSHLLKFDNCPLENRQPNTKFNRNILITFSTIYPISNLIILQFFMVLFSQTFPSFIGFLNKKKLKILKDTFRMKNYFVYKQICTNKRMLESLSL